MINRREALSRVALIMGGTVLGAEAFLSGCKTNTKGVSFSKDDIAFLNEVAETIIPTTSTPGAKEAKVGEFMQIMVSDCYEEKDQAIFLEGIKKLDEASKKLNGKSFMESTPEQRNTLLVALDKEAKDEAARVAEEKKTNPTKEFPKHYFTMMKQLTLSGYFTSEVGATKALRYIAVPGKFDGSYPYKNGDKAWATS
jgi:Gluconate 2-dehydrogenase subunit 3